MKGRALFLAGVAAILPSTVAGSTIGTNLSAPTAQFAPPSDPIILTRTVWRSLYDDKEIVSRRRYAIRFVPRGDGFAVLGELIESTVDAPPALFALAEMERGRADSSLFPMQLDSNGRMVAELQSLDLGTHGQGARMAQQMVRASQLTNPDKDQAESLIDQIAGIGGGADWPMDLFNPERQKRQEIRRMALPGGGEGEINVLLTVQGPLQGGLPRTVERTVVTELAGTRKTTREQWILETEIPAAH
jgi:hypothetical protein